MRYLLITALLLTMAVATYGTVINVPGDYTTIQAAVNAAADGDTILVAAGTYNEMITINKAVTVQGAGAGRSIIDGTGLTGAPSVKIVPPASGYTVTLTGFTIQNAAGTWSDYWQGYDFFPVVVSGSSGTGTVTVQNCEIVGRWNVGANDADWGIYVSGTAADVKIKYNTFRNLASNAMMAEQHTGPLEIAWNTFTGNLDPSAASIYLMIYGNKSVTAKQWIHNNTMSISGICLNGGFQRYGVSGYGTYSNVEIAYNVITDVDPSWDGITLITDYSGTESGTGSGFEDAKIIGNVIKGAGTPAARGGIRLFGLMNNTEVKYNSVTNSYRGVQLIEWPSGTGRYPVGTKINYNSLTGNTTDLYNQSSETVNAEYNWWGSSSGPGAGKISGLADYDPWLSAPAELYLDVAPESLYVRPGETVNVTLKQKNLALASSGYQAWLTFETDKLSFRSDSSSYTDSPYGLPVITPIAANGSDIDLAAGINPSTQSPTTEDADLVNLAFTAGNTDGATVVAFRSHDPATMLTNYAGDEIVPATTNSQTIIIDGTAPSVTVTSPNGGEYLKGGGSWTITWTASDTNLDPNSIKIDYWNGTNWVNIATGEANDGSYTWNPVPSLNINTAKVRVTATDLAGNSASDESDSAFTIDSTKPTVTNITLTANADGSGTDLTPGGTAIQGTYYVSVYVADNLAGVDYTVLPTITVTDANSNNLVTGTVTADPANSRFYVQITVTAASANGTANINVSGVTDKSGNVADTAADTFNVNKTTLTVNITLEQVNVASVQRYIKLVLGGDQSSGVKQTYTPLVTFTNGTGTVTFTNVPNANWTKISAKDEQHTLRQTVSVTDPSGNKQYVANFTGTDQLLGGDVNNDNMVDIRDFGIYAGQYGTSPALNTQWPIRNANISCDGYVDTNDFTYIQINFLKVSDPDVGYAIASAQVPLSSITVNELAKQIGVVAAKKADLNYDGVVDQKDMALFAKKK